MRSSSLLCTASVLTLLAGPVFAQTTQGTEPVNPTTDAPAMAVEAPSGSPAMGTAPDTSAEAARDQPADTTNPGMATSGTATPDAGAMATDSAAISVDDMMGKTVRGSDGESLGSVEDIIIDPQSGEARQLVLSSGGFLGIGAKQIAVDLASANLSSQDDALVLPNMTQADVEAMPVFEMEEGTVSFNSRPDATTGTTTQ
ncbi:photosystem reaction center subunit H [Skermanella aerolata]|uniref:Photosystem reaction center subunit H n=1 Tax=Skermanella aerolata TaxID=393310 RepID=A0A512DSN5_9PROT|nr:PRC-barrel domain-containing protein [Skermanella aerolata]KJB96058.1 hypothetical protein N826_37915 [Skermanella aerolata KACC 11604]GEO39501.1 photosystem reaction center subunit H [Skermanella aerolata]